jgi:hypothetical protein
MRLTVSVCALALVMSSTAALAVDVSGKCAASKLGMAGKYEFCRLKAAAKAIKAGTTPDYSKCDAALSAKWGAAETKAAGDCPTNMDLATQQAELTGDTGRTVSELSGLARFTDNGDGTITDSQTGLMWEKKVKQDNAADYANLHDADDSYEWAGKCSSNASKYCQPTAAASTACATGVEGDATGCAQCTGGDGSCNASATIWTWLAALNAASFAGDNDWRIPTRTELAALINYTDPTYPVVDSAFQGAMCSASCTDVTNAACSCTDSDGYWSASTTATSTANGWFVFFGDGYVYPLPKTTVYDVRAVR